MNLSNNVKLIRHSNAVAAGTTTITPSSGVDTKGFGGCLFLADFGAIVATAVTSVEVHQSKDDGASDAYTALLSSKVSLADTDDNKSVWLDVTIPHERYLKLIVNRGTANSTLDGITAILYDPTSAPTTHDAATVAGGKLLVSPAEGTA